MIDVESEESGYFFLFKKHHKPKMIHFYPAVPSMLKKKKVTIVNWSFYPFGEKKKCPMHIFLKSSFANF